MEDRQTEGRLGKFNLTFSDLQHSHAFILWILACSSSVAGAATYHVDPASGSMSNPGTASLPWSTLEAVFAANKTFSPGDVVLLRSGYHGAPTVKGSNSGEVTIRPDTGATPKLKNLIVTSASRWEITGLDICPEHAGLGEVVDSQLVEIASSATRITLRGCRLRSAFSHEGWSVLDWQSKCADRAVRAAGTYAVIEDNLIETTGFGLTLRKTATNSRVSRNTVKGFYLDGMQALANDCLIEYNTITDSYVDDTNHDDFFQSWGSDSSGTPGTGTISRVTVRGNVFISQTAPNQPEATEPQGMGLFDGMFEDWVIENNVIVTNTYHGISLYGAVNCKVVNNTVIENPLNTTTGKRPWIQIYQHGDYPGALPFPSASSGNLVRNNISASTAKLVSGGGTIDHNLQTTAYAACFTNYAAFDFSLKSTSSAVGAGDPNNAPAIDILQRARSTPYDLGAYEFVSTTLTAYQQWLQNNNLPVDGSGNGAPDADPLGDGVANEMKFALGLPVTTRGYGGRFTTGTVVVSDKRYLSLSYTHPEPPPSGVTYEVQSAPNLTAWTSTTTTQVSNTVTGGLRTRVFRDTVPIGEGQPRRFIRLVAEAQ